MTKQKIKIFFCDIDGTLTDGTVFYSEAGEQFKQFSHRDGRGFHLLKHKTAVKVYLITSEHGGINEARAAKFKRLGTIAGFVGGKDTKQGVVKSIARKEGVPLSKCAFIGDDTNDLEAMKICGYRACPADAHYAVQALNNMQILSRPGGKGAVREFVDSIMNKGLVEK